MVIIVISLLLTSALVKGVWGGKNHPFDHELSPTWILKRGKVLQRVGTGGVSGVFQGKFMIFLIFIFSARDDLVLKGRAIS